MRLRIAPARWTSPWKIARRNQIFCCANISLAWRLPHATKTKRGAFTGEPSVALAFMTPVFRSHARAHAASVLVVDDDPDIFTVIAELLHERSYDVLVAGDGHEALDLLASATRRHLARSHECRS
jgi:hypothetical protein